MVCQTNDFDLPLHKRHYQSESNGFWNAFIC